MLTLTVAVANLPLHFIAYCKLYVDPEPFFRTWFGSSTIIVWCALAFPWIIFLVKRRMAGKAKVGSTRPIALR
ncbi:MAG: hypothetical protein ACPLW8_05695 [Candidatus Bathyarchaeales archaeon]